ncbi:MAG: AsnC family transcriptional regulator, partial [Rhodoferax sp.]|nr:AsnC family transcriptional regulator [Rhodoferax sp.]
MLDKFDIAILNELQANGRLTNADLAQRVGLSAAPCWRRVRALEESGYILGYHAEIDRQKIGLGVLAFVRIDADRNTGDVLREMEEAIKKIPEVVACHYISGAGTFELQVVARDLDVFSQFAR